LRAADISKQALLFEKRSKNFFSSGAAHEWCNVRRAVGVAVKVFWFFFSKKNRLPFTPSQTP
jgi:hypothetical protein